MNNVVTSTKKRNHPEEGLPTKVHNSKLYNCDRRIIKNILKKNRRHKKTCCNTIYIEVTYEDCLKGCNKELLYNRTCLCPCVYLPCEGKKRIKTTSEKYYPSTTCQLCNGFTMYSQPHQILISIPAGIKNGMFQILEGFGDYSPEGTPGDLVVIFKVEEHPDFIREGNDAILTILLPQSKLKQENQIPIPTLYNGYHWLKLPPNTIPGSIIQFPNIGFYDPLTSMQGNLQCIFLINPHDEIKDVHLYKLTKDHYTENKIAQQKPSPSTPHQA